MDITYKQFTPEYVDAVLELQHTWVYENITYGVVNDTKEDMLGYNNDYFYIAVDSEKVVGYNTAEVVSNNEYNIIYCFVVIFARYRDKWLYCRHKERTT